jgi:hypothetical protein
MKDSETSATSGGISVQALCEQVPATVSTGSSEAAGDGVDADEQISEHPIGSRLIVVGQKRPPFFQQRDLLHMQSKQRISPDLVRNRETRSSCARISAKHFIQHLVREIELR